MAGMDELSDEDYMKLINYLENPATQYSGFPPGHGVPSAFGQQQQQPQPQPQQFAAAAGFPAHYGMMPGAGGMAVSGDMQGMFQHRTPHATHTSAFGQPLPHAGGPPATQAQVMSQPQQSSMFYPGAQPPSPISTMSSPFASSPATPQSSLPPMAPALSPTISPQPHPSVAYAQEGVLRAKQLLDQISQVQRQQKERLEKIRQVQKSVMLNPQKQTYDMVDREHAQLKEQTDSELLALQQLYQQCLLPPCDIHRTFLLLQDIRLQQLQLELYHQELQQLTMPHPSRCIATLVVTEQPFPMVITKGKRLDDDPVTVQLLSGSNVEFQSFSKMKVSMVWESHQAKSGTQKTIEQDTASIDSFRRSAKWNLKFLNGTRKNPVSLRFVMQVQVAQPTGAATVTIESNCTQSFIVITNECQWEESEGTLMRKDCFGEQLEIPWPQFANTMQKHFLRGTRQDPVHPARAFSLEEFEYIHAKFFAGQAMVTPKMFDVFWNWFGKTMQKLRYQRHILPLWQSGCLHGLLPRKTVQELLLQQEPGSFIVRFSERHPGLFAVAYVTDDPDPANRLHHYLVRPDDTGTKKTLPDFLADQSAFQLLLQVTFEGDDETFKSPIYRRFQKDAMLEPYYSKRSSLPPNANGYDDDIKNTYSGRGMDTEIANAE